MRRLAAVAACAALFATAAALAQEKREDREAKVRADKERVEAAAKWIYDDLPRGIEEAKKSGKPLLVVFRCIPCEACAKLDEDVVTRDPVVAGLLDEFVCVRIPHANGMDLSLFQFDYDQSWAAFFMNADMTIYGRYGTRSSQKDSADDVSLEGFAKALSGALELHAGYPANRGLFAGKRNAMARGGRPEELPGLRDRYKTALDWQGKVVPSCIHCHMVNESLRRTDRDAGGPITPCLLFPYPNPRVLGLVLDPREKAVVSRVVADSPAVKDGFRAGDAIVALSGQPILSIADVQWVLHNCAGDEPTALQARVVRDGKPVELELSLPAGWRAKGDISWRASSWDLRRMVTGGMLLEDLSDDERAKLGLDRTSMALRAKHVGQYGEHATAKNAGFLKDDVVLAIGGNSGRMTESALFARLTATTKPGDKLAVTVLREGKKVELTLPMR
jgi:serine protease Do